jgi:hypothetical protein
MNWKYMFILTTENDTGTKFLTYNAISVIIPGQETVFQNNKYLKNYDWANLVKFWKFYNWRRNFRVIMNWKYMIILTTENDTGTKCLTYNAISVIIPGQKTVFQNN